MKKKLIWISGILLFVIVLLIVLKKAGIIGKNEGTKVAVQAATIKTITETVNASGKIYPEIEVKVSPDISGEVVDLYVNEGDTVKKGQTVARIYADIYASQRDQVEAGVNQAKAQLGNIKASIEGLKATFNQAKTNYTRQQKLLADKVISNVEFEQAQQTYLAAESNLKAANENIKTYEAQIKSADAQLSRANKDLARTVIVAPMDGVVSLLGIKKGERVAGNSFNVGTEMMRIADMRSIEARVDVGENDIPKVKIGDTALVEADAYTGRKFKGIVYKIANPSTGSSLTASGTEVTNYKVHIRLFTASYADLVVAKKAFPFRPGMSASADIQTNTKSNILTVPINAVTTRDKNEGKNADKKETKPTAKSDKESDTETKNTTSTDDLEEVVFVVQKDNTVKKVKVKTGIQDLNDIEITQGIKKGEEVVIAPYNEVSKTLKNGDKVKVVAKDLLFEVNTKKD